MNARTWLEVRIGEFTEGVDPRDRWIAIGRSTLALGALTTLLFTPMAALTVPIAGGPAGPVCASFRAVSILCIGNPAELTELRRWIMIAVLAAAAAGYRPRITGPLHLWVAFSVATSITLPDGGDAIGLIILTLLLPISLADGRRWQWSPSALPLAAPWQSIVAASHLAVRMQLAFIYLDSGISKFATADWSNGTAEYYFLRDPMYGDGGPFAWLSLWASSFPLGTVTMTWGAIIVEIAIGLTLLMSWRWRRLSLTLDALLHVGIIVTIGLWSFSIVMIGAATICASPLGKAKRPSPAPARIEPGGRLLDARAPEVLAQLGKEK
ncbi:sporulation-delaying protein SdpB family protein [Leifsonia sp. NPDC058230]|uniref:sporulation-delaying protein SdpB family protein n=1 Tax=Leifsonia sp. NPDC058230 TaxID=3346391 RepID=UPI0036DAA1BC